jgi:Na+/H+ antiporter NhaD/arsenite permease-like protein
MIGSVANLIVLQHARADGIDVSFWDYFEIGAPLTVLTIVVSLVWI